MLLSIMGFVVIGLLIVVGLVMTISRPAGFSFVSLLPLLLLTIIYFFPIYYLYQFSKYSKEALKGLNPEVLSVALKYLKMHFRFMCILLIVVLGIYLMIALIALGLGGFNSLGI